MITYSHGNIFNTECRMLVNPVNCVGVMGKGLALGFKSRYPEMYADYVRRCTLGEIDIGSLTLFKEHDKTIINFPTKNDWRDDSKISDIYSGLLALRKLLDVEPYSVAIPPLGCGNGRLAWEDVHPLITSVLGGVPTPVEVYLPR